MLNQSARSLTSECVLDARLQAAPGGPISLTCASCGGKVELPFWQPRARCPHCDSIGYPDRALRNLLPMGWDCPACGAHNDGQANFCLTCGEGLASRCPRCEAPVYGPICLRCGEHQARAIHLSKGQSERVEWLPVQRERIDKQAAHLRSLEGAEQAAPEPVLPPRPAQPETKAERKARERAERRAQRAQRSQGGGFSWWNIMIILGGLWMISSWFGGRSGPQSAAAAPAQVAGAMQSLQGWASAALPSLGQIGTLKSDDPRYAYVFGILLVGVIAVPFGLYLVERLIKRLFP